MKIVSVVVCFLALAFTIAGCATNAYVTTKERVDIDVAGNQGVIYGTVPQSHKVANPTRDIVAVDVELPTMQEVRGAATKNVKEPAPTQDQGVWGNAGEVSKGQAEGTTQQVTAAPAAPVEQPKPEKIK